MKLGSILRQFLALSCYLCATGTGGPAHAQATLPLLRIVVNSNQDGPIKADEALTLREAVQILNGTLPLERLSATEKAQTKIADGPRIEFKLPQDQTTIALQEMLPALSRPGLTIDGSTQPGYKDVSAETAPIVAITAAADREVLRGLSITADRVTIRGLSLYGFTSRHLSTASVPPADIFISDQRLLPDAVQSPALPTSPTSIDKDKTPPKDILIESNWLGARPHAAAKTSRSAFGVSVFNSLGTTIQKNRIAYHEGSGIITSVRADNLLVKENTMEQNGLSGMPDAIRLEGIIHNARILSNVIQNNNGSAIFVFKPEEGSAQIKDNTITGNGKRFKRAAIYLMGNQHQVINNQIAQQSGPGVTIAAYPKSEGNIIQGNKFSGLEGLSIDLLTQQNVGVQDYQQGDGANPPHNSEQRRRETANFGMEAPRFLSPEFFRQEDHVVLDGIAAPNAQIEIYRVKDSGNQGPLNELVTTVQADEKGRFSARTDVLKVGERVSATATLSQYGTSEPAVNSVIETLPISTLKK
jgi:Right handed beta helix region